MRRQSPKTRRAIGITLQWLEIRFYVICFLACLQAPKDADDPARLNLDAKLAAAAKEDDPPKDGGNPSSLSVSEAGAMSAAKGEGLELEGQLDISACSSFLGGLQKVLEVMCGIC